MNISTTIEKPQLRPTVLSVAIPVGRLAFHRGTRQTAENLVIPDADGWRERAVQLMDGSRSASNIHDRLVEEGYRISPPEVSDLLSVLAQHRIVAEGSELSREGLSAAELERYSRNLNAWAGIATDERSPGEMQAELRAGHALVFGLGGLGSSVAVALTMAGCGHITIVDFDRVELSNLNRQQYTTDDIGLLKVEVLSRRLRAINPEVRISPVEARLGGPGDARKILGAHLPMIAVAAADRPTIAVDRWINDACFENRIPYVNASVSAGTGMVFSKVPGSSGCFNCDELRARDTVPDHYAVRRSREATDSIPATSAFGFGAMAVAAMISSEVVRYLVRLPMASAGRLVAMDFATLRTSVTEKPSHPRCHICRTATRSIRLPAELVD
jgi:molybdopterin-synthase adenylyltransferase